MDCKVHSATIDSAEFPAPVVTSSAILMRLLACLVHEWTIDVIPPEKTGTRRILVGFAGEEM